MARVGLRGIVSLGDRAAVMGLRRGPGQDQYLNSMRNPPTFPGSSPDPAPTSPAAETEQLRSDGGPGLHVALSASVGGSRDRQQRRRPKSRHTDGSGYADVYLHGPCTGRQTSA
jgi:hypothetical protein